MNAFSDIFITCNNSGPISERCEIELNPNSFRKLSNHVEKYLSFTHIHNTVAVQTNDTFFIKQVDSKMLDLCLNKLSLDNSNTSASVFSAANQQQQRINANNLTQLQQNQLTSCFNNNPNNYFYINTGQSNNVVQNKENYIYGKYK